MPVFFTKLCLLIVLKKSWVFKVVYKNKQLYFTFFYVCACNYPPSFLYQKFLLTLPEKHARTSRTKNLSWSFTYAPAQEFQRISIKTAKIRGLNQLLGKILEHLKRPRYLSMHTHAKGKSCYIEQRKKQTGKINWITITNTAKMVSIPKTLLAPCC